MKTYLLVLAIITVLCPPLYSKVYSVEVGIEVCVSTPEGACTWVPSWGEVTKVVPLATDKTHQYFTAHLDGSQEFMRVPLPENWYLRFDVRQSLGLAPIT